MSVINQMLLDLERRRASGEERNHIPDHVRALPGATGLERDRILPLIVTGVVGVCVAAAGAYWLWHHGIPGVAKPPLIAAGASVPRSAEITPLSVSLSASRP